MTNLQLECLSSTPVGASQNVIFDTITTQNGDISYDTSTGNITFNEVGTYKINWWVATQASMSNTGPIFSFVTSNNQSYGNSPIKADQVNGVCLLEVSSTPVTASIVNDTSQTYYYSQAVPVKACIVITKLTENEGSSVIPYSLSNASISVFGAEENIQFCNFTFGSDNYQQYNATGLPQTISDFPEILSFSMPLDGNITNISASFTGSGEMGVEDVSVQLALYEAAVNEDTFNLINSSLTILEPSLNTNSSLNFTVTGTQTLNYSITSGTKIALMLFVRATNEPSVDSYAELGGNFSGGVAISF